MNRPDRKSKYYVITLINIYEVHRVVRIIQPESRRRKIVARGWRAGGIWCYCLMGMGFQFCKRKGVLEMNGGDGITL